MVSGTSPCSALLTTRRSRSARDNGEQGMSEWSSGKVRNAAMARCSHRGFSGTRLKSLMAAKLRIHLGD